MWKWGWGVNLPWRTLAMLTLNVHGRHFAILKYMRIHTHTNTHMRCLSLEREVESGSESERKRENAAGERGMLLTISKIQIS